MQQKSAQGDGMHEVMVTYVIPFTNCLIAEKILVRKLL